MKSLFFLVALTALVALSTAVTYQLILPIEFFPEDASNLEEQLRVVRSPFPRRHHRPEQDDVNRYNSQSQSQANAASKSEVGGFNPSHAGAQATAGANAGGGGNSGSNSNAQSQTFSGNGFTGSSSSSSSQSFSGGFAKDGFPGYGGNFGSSSSQANAASQSVAA